MLFKRILLGATNVALASLDIALAEARAKEEDPTYGMSDLEKINYYLKQDKYVVFREDMDIYADLRYEDEYKYTFKGAFDTEKEARLHKGLYDTVK